MEVIQRKAEWSESVEVPLAIIFDTFSRECLSCAFLGQPYNDHHTDDCHHKELRGFNENLKVFKKALTLPNKVCWRCYSGIGNVCIFLPFLLQLNFFKNRVGHTHQILGSRNVINLRASSTGYYSTIINTSICSPCSICKDSLLAMNLMNSANGWCNRLLKPLLDTGLIFVYAITTMYFL